MKTGLICCLILAFSMSSYCQKKSLNIEGAWKLVQYQTINGDSVVINFPGKVEMDDTKIWSGNNFMFFNRTKIDTTVKDWYGVGTFTLNGNNYEEYVRLMNYNPWQATTIKMLLTMKSDTLIQTYPVDDKGQMDKKEAYIEKYIKIKK